MHDFGRPSPRVRTFDTASTPSEMVTGASLWSAPVCMVWLKSLVGHDEPRPRKRSISTWRRIVPLPVFFFCSHATPPSPASPSCVLEAISAQLPSPQKASTRCERLSHHEQGHRRRARLLFHLCGESRFRRELCRVRAQGALGVAARRRRFTPPLPPPDCQIGFAITIIVVVAEQLWPNSGYYGE